MANIYEPSPEMQDIYDKDKEKYRERDKLIEEGKLKEAAKKKLKGEELYNRLSSQIGTVVGDYWQGARTIDNKYNPLEYIEAGLARTIEGVGHVAGAPGISHALRVIDSPFWAARQAAGGALEHGFGVDPRYGHTAVGILELFKGPAIASKTSKFLKRRLIAQVTSNPYSNLRPLTNQLRLTQPGTVGAMRYGHLGDTGGELRRWMDTDFLAKQQTRMKAWEMEDGIFDWFTYRRLTEGVGNTPPIKGSTPKRSFTEFFQTPRQYAQNYKGVALREGPEFKARWIEFLQKRGIDPQKIQLHHIDALHDSMPLYHGLAFNSDEWWDLTATLLKENVRPGTTFYKGKGNLKYVIGGSGNQGLPGKSVAMPHGVAHLFYKDKLVDFFNGEELLRMTTEPGYRLEKAKEFAKIVNKSEDIVNQAMKTWESLNPKGNLNFDETLEFLATLINEGLLPATKIANRYQVPQMKELILEIQKAVEELPPSLKKSDAAFEYWLLNTLIDKGVSDKIFNPVKRKIKKKYK